MLTAVISDLHLGTLAEADVLRTAAARERLFETLAAADRIVLLGDTLELRERPVAALLEATGPFFAALGATAAGKRITIVPGNHDHALGQPWLTRMGIEGGVLGPEQEWPVVGGDGIGGHLAALMPDVELTLAYPGLHLRPDVYATHGHYLDLHLTIPRVESVVAHAVARAMGRGEGACVTAADHETVLTPLYGFYGGFAQGAPERTLGRGGNLSRAVWRRLNGDGDGTAVGRLVLSRVAIPGAVATLNRLGVGPLRPEINAEELRRSGLRAMGTVADRLGVEAEHVLFGHTHRAGPLAGDDLDEWRSPTGKLLHNTGNWYHEPALHGDAQRRTNPYAAGTVTLVRDDGPPERVQALTD
jgi:calcineurin-like phosphoesterase family protein